MTRSDIGINRERGACHRFVKTLAKSTGVFSKTSMNTGTRGRLGTFVICAWTVVGVWAAAETAPPASSVVQTPQAAAQTPAAGPRCRVEGHVRSGNLPLPGASVIVQVGDAVKAATSTDTDGKFTITFSPNATYHIAAELTAFTRADRDLTLAAPPCDTTLDFVLSGRDARRRRSRGSGAPVTRRGSCRADTASARSRATSAASGATLQNPAADQRAQVDVPGAERAPPVADEEASVFKP
jgi:hypothetical protein